MNKKYIFILGIFFLWQSAFAQVRVYTRVNKSNLSAQEVLQLTLSLENASGGTHNFAPPEGFQVYAGPSKSSSSSTTIINGQVESKETTSITYYLLPQKTGTLQIPRYTYTDKSGQSYQTEPISVEVSAGQTQTQTSNNASNTTSQDVSNIEAPSEDIFLRIEPSKKSVFIGEPVLLRYVLYTALDISSISKDEKPKLSAVWSESLPLDVRGYDFEKKLLGNRYFGIYTFKKELIYPQKEGKISVAPWVLGVVSGDGFFSRRREFALQSKPFAIDVKPLPSPKPANFKGLVGDFSWTATWQHIDSAKVNQALGLKIKLQGTGNMMLFSGMDIALPKDFEIFEPKVESALQNNENGVSGSKTFTYIVIPRFAGKYTLPSIALSYFDVKTQSYKTLQLPSKEITVQKGLASALDTNQSLLPVAPKQKVETDFQNIRYVHADLGNYQSTYFSLIYLVFLMLSLVLIVFALWFLLGMYRKSRAQNYQLAMEKAFKQARGHLAKSQPVGDVLYRSLVEQLARKYDMPLSAFSKENLQTLCADAPWLDACLTLLSDLEMARFSPLKSLEQDREYLQRTIQLTKQIFS